MPTNKLGTTFLFHIPPSFDSLSYIRLIRELDTRLQNTSGGDDKDFCNRSSYCSAAEERERQASAQAVGVAGREDWI